MKLFSNASLILAESNHLFLKVFFLIAKQAIPALIEYLVIIPFIYFETASLICSFGIRSISNLFHPMKFDKTFVVGNIKCYRTSCSSGNTKVKKRGSNIIKIWNTKFYLNISDRLNTSFESRDGYPKVKSD